jgi:hypothetical protein
MLARTKVVITIDTECSEERMVSGRLRPPVGYDTRIWGRFRNQERPLGIPLIMDELEACGLTGTFFVEPLAQHHFGMEGLGEVCQGIRNRGHDVQLHVHPNHRRIEWRRPGLEPLPTLLTQYSEGEQRELLREGLESLIAAGVPRESLTCFRAADFGADEATWRAMAGCGLSVSSNYNLCSRWCRLSAPVRTVDAFQATGAVMEVPISTFAERAGFRHLQISAVSAAETLRYLRAARRMGVSTVCIVTHCFEFFHLDSVDPPLGRLNGRNLERLRTLCRYLRRHAGEFEVETLAELGEQWQRSPWTTTNRIPRGSTALRMTRHVEQAAKRVRKWMAPRAFTHPAAPEFPAVQGPAPPAV